MPEPPDPPQTGFATVPDPDEPAPPPGRSSGSGQRSWWRRLLLLKSPEEKNHNTAIIVAYIGFAGTVGAAWLTMGPSSCSVNVSRGNETPGRRAVASILHAPVGVTYAYELPSLSSKRAKPRSVYRENETFEVVCQIRDGEPVTMPGDGRPNYAVSVWDQLPDGSWIPDIFTSLGSKRGPKPPAGIPVCADTSATVP